MKILGLLVLVVLIAGAAGFFFLAQKSKSGTPPGLVEGKLAPCPTSPNCVSSEAGTDESHLVAPLPADSWERLPGAIEAAGGRIVELRDDYIAAAFATKLMGYVDDVEFRKTEEMAHVRSASRVGHSDMGANRKRVEALRAGLS